MSVEKPGFAERVFEFAFNAQYCDKHRAVLAACPYLPSQQQEKRLGYDVKFLIDQRGGGVSSLFLQHKVSRYVDSRSNSNARFFDAVRGPYFAFQLDIEQYNLIHHATSHGTLVFYYCAPAFATRIAMNAHFFAKTVLDSSVWLDVAGCGEITDTKSHCITYNADGSEAWRFSGEPIKAKAIVATRGPELVNRLDKFDLESVGNIYEALFSDLKDWWSTRQRGPRKAEIFEARRMPEHLPPHREVINLRDAIEAVRELAVDYYGVSWLVGVNQ